MSKPSRRLNSLGRRPASSGVPLWAVVALLAGVGGGVFVLARSPAQATVAENAPAAEAAASRTARVEPKAKALPPEKRQAVKAEPVKAPAVEPAERECGPCNGLRMVACEKCRGGVIPTDEFNWCDDAVPCRQCLGVNGIRLRPTLDGLARNLRIMDPAMDGLASDPAILAAWEAGDILKTLELARAARKDLHRLVQEEYKRRNEEEAKRGEKPHPFDKF